MKRDGLYTHAQSVLHEWGAWARRPQFWARLRCVGMFSHIPMKEESRPPMRDIHLSPQCRDVHRAVMAMEDKLAGILYAYYVRGIGFDDKPTLWREYGIGRTKFYELLRQATLMAYNRSRVVTVADEA